MHVVTCQGKQKSLVNLGSHYPQSGSRRRPQAGGGSVGDADVSGARAEAVTKQPRFMEQNEEQSRKAALLVQEVSRSIAAVFRPLECGRAVWFWPTAVIL
jgi:hypothetical protein